MSDTLITKYRPTKLDQVIGQAPAVRTLKRVIETKASRTFLFSGLPGVGKTTLARIVAELLGCPAQDIIEVDGASKTGIDDMRAVAEELRWKPLGDGASKAVIVDECHALSKSAITSLLKILEEPPPWVVWGLCTSEVAKLPEAIKTRCTHVALKPVDVDELVDLLEKVNKAEKYGVPEKIIDLCAQEANGSPRQALANLTACLGVGKNEDEARALLRSASESKEAIDLARALVKGSSWRELQKLLGAMKDVNPESVRHVVRAYLTKVALGARSEDEAGRALEILDAFLTPFHSSDGISPLVMAVGRVVLGRAE